jgi:pSer/pThr/pTyr-binding forkhead associated (FHA) protein
MQAALVVQQGTQKDRPVPLPETIFLIGRDRQCHLRPHCELVSKLHCAVVAWAGRVRVRDLRSRNGTFLNGRRIDGEVVVNDGDQLRVGTVVLVFRIKNLEGGPPAAPIKKDDVQWLLDCPADDAVLSSAQKTRIRLTPDESNADPDGTEEPAAGAPAIAATKRPSKVVSAGHHLREYFERH